MPERRRWQPVKGTQSRVYRTRERLLLGALELPLRLASALTGLGSRRGLPLDAEQLREVLVLRLDRIGDLVMSMPALAELRTFLPHARIRLAVGSWGQEIAKRAPVDEVLVWSAPWVGRPPEGAENWRALVAKARGLARERLDLAIDLQGDVRASMLMALTGARWRVGYANTGGAVLLTHIVPLDETVSWVEQNRRAVRTVVPASASSARFDVLTEADRSFATRLFDSLHLDAKRPLVGIHPSGGRLVKQWPVERWAEVGARLRRDFGATVIVTGAAADRPLAETIRRVLGPETIDLTGRLTVLESLAFIARLDLFLSPDTGPMHMACAVATPSVAVFGPSDPLRYFSGGSGAAGSRHVVVRRELWCSPCNLIRVPPDECGGPEAPECLRGVSVDDVYVAAAGQLRAAGRAVKPT